MSPNAPLQEQLRSLTIPREQRPTGGMAARRAWGRGLIVTIFVAALLAGGGYLGWRILAGDGPASGFASAAEVPLLKVTDRGEMDQTPLLTATGKIVSDHQVEVATKVSGQIVALYFEQGDRVVGGQLLGRIEDVIYRANRDQATAMLAKANAELEFHKVNFDRVSRLFQEHQAPDIEYAEARRQLEAARGQVAASEAALAAAEKMLVDCDVLAPIAGVILQRNVEVGDFVAAEGGRGMVANAQLASIADMTKLRVEIDVSELDVGRLWPDMPCAVVPDAHKDRKYAGHVMWIDPGANYSKATVQVKVRIHDPDEHLRVEGAAQVRFFNAPRKPDLARGLPLNAPDVPHSEIGQLTSSQPTASIWIPLTACRPGSSADKATVLVLTDGRLRETSVVLGRREASDVEVLSGLVAGQEIAADAQKVRHGQRVR